MPPVVRLRKCLYGLHMASAMFKENYNKVDDFGIISPTTAIGSEIMEQMRKIYNLQFPT